jgi:hypothetical protein
MGGCVELEEGSASTVRGEKGGGGRLPAQALVEDEPCLDLVIESPGLVPDLHHISASVGWD